MQKRAAMDSPLRRARPGDGPALVALLAELCAGDPRLAQEAVTAALRPGPRGHETWVLPGRGASPVHGVLALEPSSQPGFRVGSVEWIAVAPEARRRGHGLALLQLAQRRARAVGWRQLHVSTFHTNRPALHLYIEAGFYPAATLHDYAGPGLHYVELVWPMPRRGRGGAARRGSPAARTR